ncbi:CapA family protein [Paenibacillus sp. CMAA1364]
MHLSRTNNKRSDRKRKNKYFNKSSIILNVILMVAIGAVLSVYWITEGKYTEDIQPITTTQPTQETPTDILEPTVVAEPIVVPEPTVNALPPAKEDVHVNEPSKPDQSNEFIANSDSMLTINFAGDMMFAGKVESLLKEKGYDYPFQHLGDLFHHDDLTMANLETPITTSGIGATNKQFVFKSSPKALDALKKAGMDAVGLANNHILDQGVTGMLDTIKHLNKSGIQYAGAGKDHIEAYAPTYFKRQGVKIALVALSRVVPEESWHAGKDKPGVATVYTPDLALKSIAKARVNADIVIVMAHWGQERNLNPIKNQIDLAHQFVDAGADLVIGAHPHVLQGLEQYKGKWIAYSTGNFIFTKSSTASTWRTAIFSTSCTPKGDCKMKLIPFHAEIGQPVPMSAQEGQQLFKDIEKLSIGGVKINKDGTVIKP